MSNWWLILHPNFTQKQQVQNFTVPISWNLFVHVCLPKSRVMYMGVALIILAFYANWAQMQSLAVHWIWTSTSHPRNWQTLWFYPYKHSWILESNDKTTQCQGFQSDQGPRCHSLDRRNGRCSVQHMHTWGKVIEEYSEQWCVWLCSHQCSLLSTSEQCLIVIITGLLPLHYQGLWVRSEWWSMNQQNGMPGLYRGKSSMVLSSPIPVQGSFSIVEEHRLWHQQRPFLSLLPKDHGLKQPLHDQGDHQMSQWLQIGCSVSSHG